MLFDPYNEFPHSVSILQEVSVPNGMGGSKKEWQPIKTIDAFMDTPKSDMLLRYQQIGIKVVRALYFIYGEIIPKNARIEFEGELFEKAGDPEDQGGQHEKMLLPLKKVIV